MKVQLYGIKTCSSCTKSMKWLDSKGIEYAWVDVRQKAPSKSRIAGWVKSLGNKKLRNTSGQSYRALGTEKKEWGDTQWISAFENDAMLLKRPVLEVDGVAVETGFKEAVFAARFS